MHRFLIVFRTIRAYCFLIDTIATSVPLFDRFLIATSVPFFDHYELILRSIRSKRPRSSTLVASAKLCELIVVSAKLYELKFSIDTLVDFEIDTLEASAKLYARSVREALRVDFSVREALRVEIFDRYARCSLILRSIRWKRPRSSTLVASAKLYELIFRSIRLFPF